MVIRDIACMREIVFRVLSDRPGQLVAQTADQALTITAPTLEELHHEAREALIQHLGAAHGTVRVRIRRAASNRRVCTWRRSPACCT